EARTQRPPSTTPSVSAVSVRQLIRRTGLPRCSAFWSMDDQLDDTIWFGRPSTALEAAVPFDPTERRQIGHRDLHVTRLGLGGASIGGLFEATDEQTAVDTVNRAWDLGIRLFDTAPLYGYGNSERRMGGAPAPRPRGG